MENINKVLLKICLKKLNKFQMNFHPFYMVNKK